METQSRQCKSPSPQLLDSLYLTSTTQLLDDTLGDNGLDNAVSDCCCERRDQRSDGGEKFPGSGKLDMPCDDTSIDHARAYEKRHAKTGELFLRSSFFEIWLKTKIFLPGFTVFVSHSLQPIKFY
jgi:hypothetical protein